MCAERFRRTDDRDCLREKRRCYTLNTVYWWQIMMNIERERRVIDLVMMTLIEMTIIISNNQNN